MPTETAAEKERRVELIKSATAKGELYRQLVAIGWTLDREASDRIYDNTPSYRNKISVYGDDAIFGAGTVAAEMKSSWPDYFAGSGVVTPRGASPGQKVESHAEVESESMVTVEAIRQGARRVEQERLISERPLNPHTEVRLANAIAKARRSM